ncbi:hypothetical protein [Priestia filamentosa]|uniref:hypothetical protein n=1 Tax=Priestia filamentosa TaxID=1402861 RepID=UPI000662050F|nr:hypothetical protein [Priestia filamentosa]
MSVSIYYTAQRKQKLTDDEQAAIHKLILDYSVDQEIEKYVQTGEGYNWTSFDVYNPEISTEENVIFEGSTQLPDNSEEAMWEGVQHWSSLLSQIRCVISDAEWHVHIDDHVLFWDEEYLEYDLSK